MTITTRDQAMEALLALVKTAADFKTFSRRFKTWDTIARCDKPAVLITEPDEMHVKGKLQTPAVRTMTAEIWLFIATGLDPKEVPATTLDDLLDAIDPVSGGVLNPGPMFRQQTLGNLVTDCYIEGKIMKIPGDLDGMGVAMIPVKIVMP